MPRNLYAMLSQKLGCSDWSGSRARRGVSAQPTGRGKCVR